MSVNLEQLTESLSSLTVLELAELSKKLEEKWGVSAASFACVGPFPFARRIALRLAVLLPGAWRNLRAALAARGPIVS